MSGVGRLPKYAAEETCVCWCVCVCVCLLGSKLIHVSASPRTQSQGVLVHAWLPCCEGCQMPCCIALVLSNLGYTPGPTV